MLEEYYIAKLLGMQEVEVKKIEKNSKKIVIEIELKRKKCKCPACGKETDRVHDYRRQIIRDLPISGTETELRLHKRRYACSCGKRFAEPNDFLQKYQRMTNRVFTALLEKLACTHSYTSVGEEYGISSTTVKRVFQHIQYAPPLQMPEVVGIDEFKGNTGGEKFHTILTDISGRRVIDIMRTRKIADLCTYFKRTDRSHVQYFVSDMYQPYREIANTYFPHATHVIDKYHWIRQTIWAFENVRKEVQKKFSKQHRIYFKHSRRLLLKRLDNLNPDEQCQVMVMLDCDARLSTAYFLKEALYAILDMHRPENQKTAFAGWIEQAEESGIGAFETCAKTYRNWFTPITNSFFCPYTNGFTEGCNNKIKVLKRNAFGLRDFRAFRNRILFMFQSPERGDA